MADLKITQLPVVTVVGDSDPLAVVVAGVTSQITKENLLTGFGGGPSAAEVAALIAASGHLNAAEVAALIAAAGHQSAAQVTALIAASGHQSAAQVAALIAAAGGTGTTAPAVPAIVVGDLPSPADATGTQFYGVEEGNSGHAESINFAKGVADRAVLNIVADRLSDAFGYQAIYGFNRTAISGVDIGGGVFPLPVVILRAYIAPASGAPANWKLVVDTASSALAFAHIDVTVVPTRSAVQAAVRCFRVVGSADNAARYETGPHNLTRPFVVGERFQIKIKGFGQTNFANIAPPDYFLTLSTEEDLARLDGQIAAREEAIRDHLGTAAERDIGTVSGRVALLGVGGLFGTSLLGSGPKTVDVTLHGDGVFRPVGSTDSIKRVTKIPTAFDEPVLYLTHDAISSSATPDNATLTPGVGTRKGGEFFGWRREGSVGEFSESAAPLEAIGSDNGTTTGAGQTLAVATWAVEFVMSRNQDFGANWPVIVIGGAEYALSSPYSTDGVWLFPVVNPPAASAGAKTINFRSALGSGVYLFSDSEAVTHEAGLWEWDATAYTRVASGGDGSVLPQLRALAGPPSSNAWTLVLTWLRHRAWWTAADISARLLGVSVVGNDVWAATRGETGAMRVRLSSAVSRVLNGANYDPDDFAVFGTGGANTILLKGKKLLAWAGSAAIADLHVGTTPAADYSLYTPQNGKVIGIDVDGSNLYDLVLHGTALSVSRGSISLVSQPAHSGTDELARGIFTAGPLAQWMFKSGTGPSGSVADGADLEITPGLTIGAFDMHDEYYGVNELARMVVTVGSSDEYNASTSDGSYTGDAEIAPNLTISRIRVTTTLDAQNNQRTSLTVNRSGSASFSAWRSLTGNSGGVGKSFYLLTPAGLVHEYPVSGLWTVGGGYINWAPAASLVIGLAPPATFTLIVANSGGLTRYSNISVGRTAASTIAFNTWFQNETTHALYYVAPDGTITEMTLAHNTETTDWLLWLVSGGPRRPAANAQFKLIIARKGGITAAAQAPTISAPSLIAQGAAAWPAALGTPISMSVRSNKLSVLADTGQIHRWSTGASGLPRLAAEDIDTNQRIGLGTRASVIQTASNLILQTSDYVRKWGVATAEGAGGAGGGTGTGGGATSIGTGRVRNIFFARAASKPASPHYVYTGPLGGYSPGPVADSTWQSNDPDAGSQLPLWLATSESLESGGLWTATPVWTVAPLTAFAARYATHWYPEGTTTWHAPPEIPTDRWIQLRDNTGRWTAPLLIARGETIDPWTPVLVDQTINATATADVHEVFAPLTLNGRKELLFQVRLMADYGVVLGRVQSVWGKRTGQGWNLAAYGSAAEKDSSAFRLQAHRRSGLSIARDSSDAQLGDIIGVQATFWVRLVQPQVGGADSIDRIQIFGFGATWNQGRLSISAR